MKLTAPNITPGDWRVIADPEFQGLHPAHDSRYVATEDATWSEDGETLEAGSLIVSTRDGDHQAANARAIAAVPALLKALEFAHKMGVAMCQDSNPHGDLTRGESLEFDADVIFRDAMTDALKLAGYTVEE